MKPAALVICCVLGVAGAGQLAHSHSVSSTIHGVVTDPSGAVIPGAMVTINSPHWTHTVSTNETGEYRVSGLDPGDSHCRVVIRYGGFMPFEKSTFVLAPGMLTEADAQLDVHPGHQAVTVYE